MQGRGNDGMLLECARRRYDNNARDTGNLGRNYIHQNGGRIGRTPARHIDSDAVQRKHSLAQNHSAFAVFPGFLHLPLVIGIDVENRLFQIPHESRIGFLRRCAQIPEGARATAALSA